MPIKMNKRDAIIREKPSLKPLCTVQIQDGAEIEMYSGDAYCPPGRKGLHVNSSGCWVKAMGYWWLLNEQSAIKAKHILERLPNILAVEGVSSFHTPLNAEEK